MVMEDFNIFDEDNAVEFIRKTLPVAVDSKYSDDEILYIIDIIWDYYEKKGLTSLNDTDTDDEELDVADLTAYVRREAAKDKELIMDPGDIGMIVKGELEYEESIEEF